MALWLRRPWDWWIWMNILNHTLIVLDWKIIRLKCNLLIVIYLQIDMHSWNFIKMPRLLPHVCISLNELMFDIWLFWVCLHIMIYILGLHHIKQTLDWFCSKGRRGQQPSQHHNNDEIHHNRTSWHCCWRFHSKGKTIW